MTLANSVQALMNYTVDNGKPAEYYFYEPDPGVELIPPGPISMKFVFGMHGQTGIAYRLIVKDSSSMSSILHLLLLMMTRRSRDTFMIK